MKKAGLVVLIGVAVLALAVASTYAGTKGVTEIKLYTNENPQRFYGSDPVGPGHAANYLGYKGDKPHVNALLVRIGMNADIDVTKTPPDSNQLWVTPDAAAVGPYGIHYHFVTMPNPRTWFDIWRSDTPGYTEYLDVSSTERVTFWIKGEPDCSYPLWLRVRSQNHPVDGKDVEGAYVTIDGETIIKKDPFGYFFAFRDVPFNGEWQFVSIPWEFLKLDSAGVAEVIPYSWAGTKPEGHHVGADLDLTTIRTWTLDTKEGGIFVNYPWPEGGQPVGSCDYMVDEIVFTLEEGTGVVGVDGQETVMPLTYELGDAYPNPFNPSTTIDYALPVSNRVLIEIYNSLGQKVRTLVDRYVTKGTYHATWDGTDDYGNAVPSGVYLYKMQSSHFTSAKKMMLTK